MSDQLLVERHGRTAVLTLNRPTVGNSLTPALIGELGMALIEMRDDPAVRAIVITGAGRHAFCTGTDLSSAASPSTAAQEQFAPPPVHLPRGLELWKPTVAAVNGMALGGGFELALACDLRYAAENATVGLPEVKIGSMPGAGGTQRLMRQIPQAWALELLLLGERWSAERALRAGLLNDVFAAAELLDRVVGIAERLAANAPLSVQAIKQAAFRGRHLALADGLALERTLFNLLRDTADRHEGRQAFAEKREPTFLGR